MARKAFIFMAIGIYISFFIYLSPLLAASLSDREAKKFIEENWNSDNSITVIRLGENIVYQPKASYEKVNINDSMIHYSDYKRLQYFDGKIIKIQKLDPSKRFSLSKLMSLDYHLSELIWIEATPKGLELSKKSGKISPNKDYIYLKIGTFSITDIVKNEEHKKGLDEFRLVMCKYKGEWEPIWKDFQKNMGQEVSDNRKAICLLKYDNFESKWKNITCDVANEKDDFKTKNVEGVLKK